MIQMMPIDAKTPLDVFEFDTLIYYPETTEISPYGLVVKRVKEFQFAIGCLNFYPTQVIPVQDDLFITPPLGFLWTCPRALKEKFSDNQVTIRDVLSHYIQINLEIGLINTAFQSLDCTSLIEIFPREELVIPELKTGFVSESQKIKECAIQDSIFFKDTYGGIWMLNRNNLSTVCLIRVALQTEPTKLKFLSDAYILNEMILTLLKENSNPDEWDELSLGQCLHLKNWLENYTAFQSCSKHLKGAFRKHSIEEIDEWVSTFKFLN